MFNRMNDILAPTQGTNRSILLILKDILASVIINRVSSKFLCKSFVISGFSFRS